MGLPLYLPTVSGTQRLAATQRPSELFCRMSIPCGGVRSLTALPCAPTPHTLFHGFHRGPLHLPQLMLWRLEAKGNGLVVVLDGDRQYVLAAQRRTRLNQQQRLQLSSANFQLSFLFSQLSCQKANQSNSQ